MRPVKTPTATITTRSQSIPDRVVAEAIDALAVRCRWYERRLYETPPRTLEALRYFCHIAGVSPIDVGKRS